MHQHKVHQAHTQTICLLHQNPRPKPAAHNLLAALACCCALNSCKCRLLPQAAALAEGPGSAAAQAVALAQASGVPLPPAAPLPPPCAALVVQSLRALSSALPSQVLCTGLHLVHDNGCRVAACSR